jgi:hypothetical protein
MLRSTPVLGEGAIAETAIGEPPELPLTALEEAVKHLRCAIAVAPTDKAAAAMHIDLARPHFVEALSWARKTKGRPPTAGERALAHYEAQIIAKRRHSTALKEEAAAQGPISVRRLEQLISKERKKP